MHVGRAQSVPSGARIRATPAPSLRTSAVVLEDETFSAIHMHIWNIWSRGWGGWQGRRTCQARWFLECNAYFGRVPSAVIAV